MKTITYYHDIVIVGAGGAGLMAAVHASKAGLSTACISKVEPTRSHTVAAKGGMNAALGNVAKDDWRWHMYDTIRGGDWLGDVDAIEYMCERAPAVVRELENMGVPFTRDENGKIYQRIYGGQSSNYGKGKPPARACAVADRTGHAILHSLYQQALKNKASFFTDHFVIDLIMDDEVCRGVVAWDMENGEINIFRAHMVVLASGGYGQAYKTNTSSSICTGDGNAMALRAGIPMQDAEFIQFHPTGLYGSGFLITEAARGEGAYFINANGERFMERYAPTYKDLAPRDVISRAMAIEIQEGRGTGKNKDHLLLCLQHLDSDVIKNKLPTVYENAKTFAKVDPKKDPIPVVPSVHYTMGGIPTNRFCEVISKDEKLVGGLMAVGETACMSVHGANRLGCNSLLDIIVFGKVAIESCVEIIEANRPHKLLVSPEEYAVNRINTILDSKVSDEAFGVTYKLQSELKDAMSEHAGVFRSGDLLVKGMDKIISVRDAISDIKIADKSLIWNTQLLEVLELDNLAIQALVTIKSALMRLESRGSHMREDFPDRDDKKWRKHSIVWFDGEELVFSTREIRSKPVDAAAKIFVPEKRSY